MSIGFFLLSWIWIQDAQAVQDDWFTVKPDEARATVRMPVEPVHRTRSFEADRGQPLIINMYLGTTPDKHKTFVFAYHDVFQKIRGKKHEKKVLDGAVEGAKGPYLGDLITDREIIKDGNRGRDFTIIINQNGSLIKIKQRVLLVEQRLYQLNVVCAQAEFDDIEANKFLDSLDLQTTPKKPETPPKPGSSPKGSVDK